MDNREIKELLKRYIAGKCTEKEKAWVETWYVRHRPDFPAGLSGKELEKDLRDILSKLPLNNKHRGWYRMAAVFACISLSALLYMYPVKSPEPSLSAHDTSLHADQDDIAPGGNKAFLTLADGSCITLDAAARGKIAEQAGTSTDIPSVMRQLSRWYNVEVAFEGKPPTIHLWREVYRNVKASQALEILRYFELNYKIVQTGESKKIIIMNRPN